ncbi:HAMP domain-containing sensor histidine kinase [Gordonia sp. (in: high G+C Gram-positive bacteria)]|uniref:sensor histidine kinase n=1 Tax=Gordonia sp. (in: high G+C Gram-positive bacteria) TaxID=84139 RepID=UPI001E0F7431|nr:HAMP domain-containing sensor histidine kinase [Gordonia sp. (in: high G+C Gram-positive bacteria)]MCB1295455.1 HAMP domain-containing histidine kinase [Gordonia sp. (in: high G+C Gram-positive bacteria)]HMS76267.1 HAMP domain-containing sensor histidine kinase [Gordonia sp. (in: high G+C Gram-positive bacteria)]HQV17350.1 HAMP domain-containing sensor histidine kinase [Gordonia sp. (in: high G+C Gram-positive bacteria)]
MMLHAWDIAQIVAIAAGCTVVVTAACIGLIRYNAHGSITSQIWLMAVASPLSVVASVTVIAVQMYVSQHDFQVLLWVLGVSAAMSVMAATVVGRTARSSMLTLRESARRIGDGDVIGTDGTGWKEFAEVSEQLSDTSRRLAAARKEIEELDASRRQFFAWISHDLRTPLTGLRAMAEVLEDGVAADPGDYIRRIRLQVGTMSRLVDDLFELSRLTEGGLRLRCEPLELVDVVSDSVSDVRAAATERGMRITHSGVAGITVWADPHELTRVVVNLLTNSIKYAPPGSEILISASVDDGTGRTVISVADQGPGVPDADLSNIFEVGWRADAARTPATADEAPEIGSSSAGLGLAIVRGIVEAHGGDVRAENITGGFRLDLSLPGGNLSPRR